MVRVKNARQVNIAHMETYIAIHVLDLKNIVQQELHLAQVAHLEKWQIQIIQHA